MANKPNYYDILEIAIDACDEEIRRAYREAVRRLHPDTSQNSESTNLFLQVQEAYETLSNPLKRTEYDAYLVECGLAPPVKLRIRYSRSALPPIADPQLIYALVELFATPPSGGLWKEGEFPPMNVGLIIDRSTSMQGERMEMVRSAAVEVIRQLREEDILSVIAFSDRAEVVLPAQAALSPQAMETMIRVIRTGGGTEILQGLQSGYHEVRRSWRKTYVNQLILLTDGRTYGDEADCLELAKEAALHGIEIDTIGVGSEWNDVLLDELAVLTGGTSAYLARSRDIYDYLKNKFRDLSSTFAKQVQLHLDLSEGVELRSVFRVQPETAPIPLSQPIRFGNITKNAKLAFLLEFIIQINQSVGRLQQIASGSIDMFIPLANHPETQLRLALRRPIDGEQAKQPPHQAVIQAISNLTLYRMQEQARQEAEFGEVENAKRRLQDLATRLLAQGKTELAKTVLGEAEHIRKANQFSKAGEKAIKYGTRRLMLPAGVENSS